jgi:RimJ/RimL family protein N-acetyltransferase
MKKYILKTERLRLREFNLHDSEFIIELFNSPGWLKFIGDRKVKTIAQAQYYLEHGPIKSYRENGYGLYLVVKKDDDKSIGMCGILNRDTLDHPDIGFAFLPNYNGKGYALEIANATMIYAKEKLSIPRITAITLPQNYKSIKLLEKMGLKYHKRFVFPNSKEELLLFMD